MGAGFSMGGQKGGALLDEGGGDILGQLGEDGLDARFVAGLGGRHRRDGRHEILWHLGRAHLPHAPQCQHD